MPTPTPMDLVHRRAKPNRLSTLVPAPCATLAVGFRVADTTLQFATFKDGVWNQGPLGPVINDAIMLVSDATTLGVFATVQGKTTLWQKCQ